MYSFAVWKSNADTISIVYTMIDNKDTTNACLMLKHPIPYVYSQSNKSFYRVDFDMSTFITQNMRK